MYERIGASLAPGSSRNCCAEIVAGTTERSQQKSSSRNHPGEGKSDAANDGDFLPGCISWVSINGRKSFSNKSLHENSLARCMCFSRTLRPPVGRFAGLGVLNSRKRHKLEVCE